MWADKNVGSWSPADAGLYFSWGNVDGHKFGSDYSFNQANYDQSPGASVSSDLDAAHDAAAVVCGSPWRTPTADEITELIDNCVYELVSLGGVLGGQFTSRINGNSVFIPVAGYIRNTSGVNVGEYGFVWSASYIDVIHVYRLRLTSTSAAVGSIGSRQYGFNVRAVRDP